MGSPCDSSKSGVLHLVSFTPSKMRISYFEEDLMPLLAGASSQPNTTLLAKIKDFKGERGPFVVETYMTNLDFESSLSISTCFFVHHTISLSW